VKIYENLNGEIWKIIEEYPDYMVSNLGRVKRIIPDKYNRKLKVLKQWNHEGYLAVELSGESQSVHRLVLMAFKPVFNMNELQCNHIDGNKKNNLLENLEWCNNSENQKHAFKIGLENNKGENHPMFEKYHSEESKIKMSKNNPNRLSNKKITDIETDIKNKLSGKYISKKYNILQSTVSRIKNKKGYYHVK
jgi:hypothetical protein